MFVEVLKLFVEEVEEIRFEIVLIVELFSRVSAWRENGTDGSPVGTKSGG